MTRFLALIVIFVATLSPVRAATIPPGATLFDGGVIISSSGGQAQVYDVGGNRLGLVGLQLAAAGDWVTRSLFDSFTAANVLGIYAGPDVQFLDAVISEFTDISDGAMITGTFPGRTDGRIFNAVWVLWEGTGTTTFTTVNATGGRRTSTISGTVTLAGNPLAVVPLPASVWLLLTAIGGLAGLGFRRRGAASAICETCPG
ncbi:MAG: VPLPA-CTERM sorting domain-containing protein [Jannaschia sp.]